MKIIVVGGSGLIGSRVVKKLGEQGHEAIAASPKSGVNTLTGEGLAAVLKNAQVVVDVSNSPSFADEAVMEFFKTSRVSWAYWAYQKDAQPLAGESGRGPADMDLVHALQQAF